MHVCFSLHAQQRIQQRLGITIPKDTEVDISSVFRKARVYQHTNGNWVETWYHPDRTQPCVMVVDRDSRAVLTVMTQGAVVDAVYHQVAQ